MYAVYLLHVPCLMLVPSIFIKVSPHKYRPSLLGEVVQESQHRQFTAHMHSKTSPNIYKVMLSSMIIRVWHQKEKVK